MLRLDQSGFLVAISNSESDVLFIADSISTGTVRFSPFTTYIEDTIAKKYFGFFFFTFRNRNLTGLKASQSAGPRRSLPLCSFLPASKFFILTFLMSNFVQY